VGTGGLDDCSARFPCVSSWFCQPRRVLVDIVDSPGPTEFPGIFSARLFRRRLSRDGSSLFINTMWRSQILPIRVNLTVRDVHNDVVWNLVPRCTACQRLHVSLSSLWLSWLGLGLWLWLWLSLAAVRSRAVMLSEDRL